MACPDFHHPTVINALRRFVGYLPLKGMMDYGETIGTTKGRSGALPAMLESREIETYGTPSPNRPWDATRRAYGGSRIRAQIFVILQGTATNLAALYTITW